MLPRYTARVSITLYNHLLIPTQDGEPPLNAYKRTVLTDCVWNQDSQTAYRKTGTANADLVTILIPFDPDYFSVQNGEVFIGDGWTVEKGPEFIGTYIVQGECSFQFPDYTQAPAQEQVFDDEAVISAEDTFVREYIQPFEDQNTHKRPKEIIEHLVGSRNLWYIEVRC